MPAVSPEIFFEVPVTRVADHIDVPTILYRKEYFVAPLAAAQLSVAADVVMFVTFRPDGKVQTCAIVVNHPLDEKALDDPLQTV